MRSTGTWTPGTSRIKLKIEPGWDVEPVRAVRERFGDDLLLQVDANTAYTLTDARHLARLDEFGLLLMEQPLPEEDVLGHARLAKVVRTPICLDESITSARTAAAAITLGACPIINIKPGRVGGYLEARRIHDVAPAQRHRRLVRRDAGDRASAGRPTSRSPRCPGSRCPATPRRRTGTTSRTSRSRSCCRDGHLDVPAGPGIGVTPLPSELAAVTTWTEWVAGSIPGPARPYSSAW